MHGPGGFDAQLSFLSAKDADMVTRRIDGVSGLPDATIPGYLDWVIADPRHGG